MKKLLPSLLIVAVVTIVSCLKNDDDYKPCVSKTVDEERPAMEKFATDSAIAFQRHQSGILYEILEEGTGPAPNATSNVTAKYTGRFLNGQQFDASSTGIEFNLSGVIQGWTIAIPLIKEGGKIKMIIPSSLAYDCHPYYPQFQNQPLYFYVELVKVNN
ncbi:FKBP-type peptidyl-prolyl cis-trans isomerase [Niabella insulamsoli]|uniref:FKBP-type peptidyl-prolyl cis-trans isomerase n=1 Tax=Niabella insulamsoli TaxID=3144874 RepID=UPI0031FCBBBC